MYNFALFVFLSEYDPFSKLFNKLYKSQLVDFRQKDILFDTSDEFNFTFNRAMAYKLGTRNWIPLSECTTNGCA